LQQHDEARESLLSLAEPITVQRIAADTLIPMFLDQSLTSDVRGTIHLFHYLASPGNYKGAAYYGKPVLLLLIDDFKKSSFTIPEDLSELVSACIAAIAIIIGETKSTVEVVDVVEKKSKNKKTII
jgi:hypothetical protein